MNDKKLYIRYCTRYEFQQRKMLLKHVNLFALFLERHCVHNTYKYWFRRFKDDDSDVSDRRILERHESLKPTI